MSLGFISLLLSLWKASVLCSAGRGAAAYQLHSASYINTEKKKILMRRLFIIPLFFLPLSPTILSLSRTFSATFSPPSARSYSLWCWSAKGRAVTNGMGKPITRAITHTGDRHQLVALYPHTSIIKKDYLGSPILSLKEDGITFHPLNIFYIISCFCDSNKWHNVHTIHQ